MRRWFLCACIEENSSLPEQGCKLLLKHSEHTLKLPQDQMNHEADQWEKIYSVYFYLNVLKLLKYTVDFLWFFRMPFSTICIICESIQSTSVGEKPQKKNQKNKPTNTCTNAFPSAGTSLSSFSPSSVTLSILH